jgi:hypothetical protein
VAALQGPLVGSAGFGRLACGDPAATFGDAAGGQFPLQAAPKAASDAVAPRFASVARGWAWRGGGAIGTFSANSGVLNLVLGGGSASGVWAAHFNHKSMRRQQTPWPNFRQDNQ